MTKTGKVELGKTPSIVSGRPANQIKDGEPVRKGEEPADAGLKKLASVLDEPKKDQ